MQVWYVIMGPGVRTVWVNDTTNNKLKACETKAGDIRVSLQS